MKLFYIFYLLLLFFVSVKGQEMTLQHPEKGILPFNAPCTHCIEDLDKRTGNTREFSAMNTDGSKTIYKQQSLGGMNMKDKDGFWRTVDPRVMQESEKVFAARMQPSPVLIDFGNKDASISNGGKELRINKDISLVHIAEDGTESTLGTGNWSQLTRSENYTETTFLLHDFYPSIDLQMITWQGRVKTNFILHKRLPFAGGQLVMRMQLSIPDGLIADLSRSVLRDGNLHSGILSIADHEGIEYFSFNRSHAYDAQESSLNNIELAFKLDGSQLDYFIPFGWLNNNSTVYPVTIDPLVTSTATLPQADIIGSGWTAVCGTQGCSYYLNNVMTPANCEISSIYVHFSYLANLPCIRPDGGFDITMTNPAGASCTTVNHYCLGAVQGACFFWPAQIYEWQFANVTLGPCLLPPQCAPYELDFEMKFSRCNWIPVIPCDASCILANSDWMMTIEGRTVELTSLTSSAVLCEGDSINLCATADWGVPPYTYTWTPGGLTGPCPTFYASISTHYTVTVSDSCGNFDTASTDIVVIPYQNPSFSILPDDTVCDGASITFIANGSAPAASYDWTINCPTPVDYTDTQSINYIAPGNGANCTATLFFEFDSLGNSCSYSESQSFVVEYCTDILKFLPGDLVSEIYPNPTDDKVTIVFSKTLDSKNIQLLNMLGEILFEKNFFKEHEITFDVSTFSKGIYLLKASGHRTSILKIAVY